MSSVVFDLQAFKAGYPRFAVIPDAALVTAFENACLLVDNTGGSAIPFKPRHKLLDLATAHILLLDQRGAETVGRVASAGQGSTNASFEGLNPGSASAAYWQQTQYGALFWKACAPYRRFFYVPDR